MIVLWHQASILAHYCAEHGAKIGVHTTATHKHTSVSGKMANIQVVAQNYVEIAVCGLVRLRTIRNNVRHAVCVGIRSRTHSYLVVLQRGIKQLHVRMVAHLTCSRLGICPCHCDCSTVVDT